MEVAETTNISASAVQPTETILLSIDIEKGGDSLTKHPILAIGVCVGAQGGKVLEKKTWCLQPLPGQEMEDRCVREFWADKPDLLAKITKQAVHPFDALRDFAQWLDNLGVRYAGRKIELVSDNPAYDIGTLDYALCANGIRSMGIRFLGDGRYRSVNDPSEMIEGQGSWGLVKAKAKEHAAHDHWPENDAEHIYWMYVYACQVRDQLAAGSRLSEVALDGGA